MYMPRRGPYPISTTMSSDHHPDTTNSKQTEVSTQTLRMSDEDEKNPPKSKDTSSEEVPSDGTTPPPDLIGNNTKNSPPSAGTDLAEGSQLEQQQDDFHPGLHLWTIILGLGVTLLLTALENTVVTVAMPNIISDLHIGEDYIWVTNAFFVCSAAIQPLVGQLSNVFGRRWIMLGSVAVFTLGSGICGGANGGSMLIAGRAVQGLGSGGITLLNGRLSGLFPK